MKKIKSKYLIFISVILIGLIAILISIFNKPTINVYLLAANSKHALINIEINKLIPSTYYVCVDNNNEINEKTEFIEYTKDNSFELTNGNYFIHIKDKNDKIIKLDYSDVYYLDINSEPKYPFYPENETIDLDYTYIAVNTELSINSSDNDVVEIKDNKIITKSKGVSTISLSASYLNESFDIEVTDLYTTYDIGSMSKPILNKTICNQEEAHKLDEVLRLLIEDAGYQTRAGVVACARFMALQFPYRLAYFSESGRLDPDFHINTDGEGRYYHTGLFLSEDKFDELGDYRFGRAYWGQYFDIDDFEDHSKDEEYLTGLLTVSDIGHHLYLAKRPNGLDCSGYVSWIYLNGGFDLGDLGAGGPDTNGMSQLGKRVNISDELLQSDQIKAGDLVGNAGHIGMVIGVEEDYIWITDTLITGTKVTRYERNKASFDELGIEAFRYFMLMDDEYKLDGNYTAIWE